MIFKNTHTLPDAKLERYVKMFLDVTKHLWRGYIVGGATIIFGLVCYFQNGISSSWMLNLVPLAMISVISLGNARSATIVNEYLRRLSSKATFSPSLRDG